MKISIRIAGLGGRQLNLELPECEAVVPTTRPRHQILPSGHFPSGSPSKIMYAFLISPMRATWPPFISSFLIWSVSRDSVYTVSFLDSASVKRTYSLWVGPNWPQERAALPPRSREAHCTTDIQDLVRYNSMSVPSRRNPSALQNRTGCLMFNTFRQVTQFS
jgi:hypothetical protein